MSNGHGSFPSLTTSSPSPCMAQSDVYPLSERKLTRPGIAEIGSQETPRDIRMNRANPEGKNRVLRRNLLKTLVQGKRATNGIF